MTKSFEVKKMSQIKEKEAIQTVTLRLLEGKRAGEQAAFRALRKEGVNGWQEQDAISGWFISEKQLHEWIELGCVEEVQ